MEVGAVQISIAVGDVRFSTCADLACEVTPHLHLDSRYAQGRDNSYSSTAQEFSPYVLYFSVAVVF